MTNKSTGFKRVALTLVAALGFGLIGVMPSQATPIAATLTIDATTTKSSSIIAGDTATATLKTTFTTENVQDSVLVKTTCLTPASAACAAPGGPDFDIDFYWTPTTDSSTGTVVKDAVPVTGGLGGTFTQNVGDSIAVSNTAAGAATSFTWSVKARTTTSTTVGTYAITFYLQGSNAGATATAANANSQSVTWNVTVTALNTTVASLVTYTAGVIQGNTAQDSISEASAQALYWRTRDQYQSAKESSIVFATTSADAQSPAAAGVIYAFAANSAGETYTATYTQNICATPCAITAVVEGGPGLLGTGLPGADAATATKSVSLSYKNTGNTTGTGETLTVYADGTAGTSTLKFYKGSTVLKSITLTFTGSPASASGVYLADTYVALSSATNTGTTTLRAVIKDAAGSALTSGTVYVYASDTKVVSSGALSTNATQYTQLAATDAYTSTTARGKCTNYSSTLGAFSCSITIADTGTATLVFRDSQTVAGSTWVSSAVTVQGVGKAASYAISFDKTSYNAGQQAVITVKGTDLAGNASYGNKNALTYTTSLALGGVLNTGTRANTTAVTSITDYTPPKVVGLTGAYDVAETFVVLMPSSSGTFTLNLKTTPESTNASQLAVTYTASVTVIDPAEVAATAAIAAAKAAETAAVAAADAATDAALQAIDAANAATDAANLAAEAADAATVAAEEAKDAADAATAAVEALATQVATLMAALQAQVRSLANTVAKIAKKVKA